MILSKEKFRLPTVRGHPIEVVLNWNKDVAGCRFIKFLFEGEEVIVPKDAFLKLAYLISNEDERDAMIPTKTVRVREFRKDVTLRLLKDMRAGEEIRTTVSFETPLNMEEAPILLNS